MQGYGLRRLSPSGTPRIDNIEFWKVNACGTPLSAAIRHPEIIPALRALCLPGDGIEFRGAADAVQK